MRYCLLAALSGILTSSFCFGAVVPVKATKIFVPNGFDSNDEVVVVLDGYLPDRCHQLDEVEVSTDESSNTIMIQQYARKVKGVCLPMLVPFHSEVRLGIIDVGQYSIVTNKGSLSADLNVKQSTTEGPDDYLYAPVDNAVAFYNEKESKWQIALRGRYTSSCMVKDDIMVARAGDIFVVQPIAKMLDLEICTDETVPYMELIDLPSELTKGRYLLHVRSLNGRAINSPFTMFREGRPL